MNQGLNPLVSYTSIASETPVCPSRRTSARRLCLLHALYGAAALLLFVLLQIGNGADARTSRFEDMIEGTADRPYVYRQLLPCIARAARALGLPQPSARQDFDADFLRRWPQIVESFSWPHSHLFEYSIVAVAQILSFCGTLWLLRALLSHFTNFSESARDFAPLGALLLLPFFFGSGKHLYDPTTLFFSAWLLWLLAARHMRWFFVAFFLACWNKETTLLFVPIFCVAALQTPTKNARWIALQGALLLLMWLGVKLFLNGVFRGNGGSVTEFHLDNTLNLWRKPQFAFFVLVVALMGFLAARDWKSKPPLLRAGLGWTLWPLAISCALFGALDEMRDYYETLPFLFCLMMPTIGALVARFGSRRATSTTRAL